VERNNSPSSCNAAPLVPAKIKRPAFHGKFSQFRLKVMRVNAQLNKSAQSHIAGNSRRTIKMQSFHLRFL
jgi:hypothetical protein